MSDFKDLKKQVQESIEEHRIELKRDGTTYNGSVILTIICTSVAALLPINECANWVTKILSGIAAILIALDKSLSWGSRWLYHRQMKQEYLIILAKISFYENLPDNFPTDQKQKYFMEIYSDLYNVRRKEVEIPGIDKNK